MTTQTSGPVWIPINLDFAEAERKLEAFKKKIPSSRIEASPGDGGVWHDFDKKYEALGEKIVHRRQQYREKLLGELRAYYRMGPVEQFDFRQGERQKYDAMWKRTHPSSKLFDMESWRDTLNGAGLTGVARRAMSTLAVPGKIALAYGIMSSTLKLLPEAAGLGRQLGGEPLSQSASNAGSSTVEELQRLFEGMRQTVVRLETQITTIFSAIGKTTELNRAALRISGKLPNSEENYKFLKEYDTNEKLLKDKFDTWKGREAPFVITQTFIDIFKRSILK